MRHNSFLLLQIPFNVNFNSMSFQETVEVFLKHPSVKDDSDLEGRTSFMWAAGKGSDDVIRTMLSLKLDIDINMTDKYAGTGKMPFTKEPLDGSSQCNFHQITLLGSIVIFSQIYCLILKMFLHQFNQICELLLCLIVGRKQIVSVQIGPLHLKHSKKWKCIEVLLFSKSIILWKEELFCILKNKMKCNYIKSSP